MTITQLLLLASICFIAMVSPGPDFLLVTRNSILYPRRQALATAFGIVAGCTMHATYCALGLAFIITQSIVLFSLIRYAGACYLVYLGIKCLTSKGEAVAVTVDRSAHADVPVRKAFLEGFLCNALNPKLAVFLLSLFTQFISVDATLLQKVLVAAVFFGEAAIYWPALVFMLQLGPVRAVFSRVQAGVDRVCGVLLIALGVKVAFQRA